MLLFPINRTKSQIKYPFLLPASCTLILYHLSLLHLKLPFLSWYNGFWNNWVNLILYFFWFFIHLVNMGNYSQTWKVNTITLWIQQKSTSRLFLLAFLFVKLPNSIRLIQDRLWNGNKPWTLDEHLSFEKIISMYRSGTYTEACSIYPCTTWYMPGQFTKYWLGALQLLNVLFSF